MYYCNNCGELTHGKWNDELHADECINCEKTDLSTATKCENKHCNGYAKPGEDFCQDCIDTLNEYINMAAEKIGDRKTAMTIFADIYTKERD